MQQITQRESQNVTSTRHRLLTDENNNESNPQFYPLNKQHKIGNRNSNIFSSHLKQKYHRNSYFNNTTTSQKQQAKNPSILSQHPESKLVTSNKQTTKYMNKTVNIQHFGKNSSPEFKPIYKKNKKFQHSHHELKKPSSSYHFHNNVSQNSLNNDHQLLKSDKLFYNLSSPKIIKKQITHAKDNLSLGGGKQQPKQEKRERHETDNNLIDSNKSSLNKVGECKSEERHLQNSKKEIKPFSIEPRNIQSLFTSPQLLAECRNFLKLRSGCKNEMDQKNNQFNQNQLFPIKLNYNQKSTNFNIINDIKYGDDQPTHENKFITQASVKVTSKQSDNDVKSEPRMTNHPKENNYDSCQHLDHLDQYSSPTSKTIQQINSAEELVDIVFEKITNQPEGFIYWDTLYEIVSQKCPQLASTFKKHLYPLESPRFALISNIGRLASDLLSKEKHESENEVKNIQQKGYITQHDVNDFLSQLQESQAEDMEKIEKYLWRLFDSADRDTEEVSGNKKVDYWGLYSRKNSKDFLELHEILRQFDFQIE